MSDTVSPFIRAAAPIPAEEVHLNRLLGPNIQTRADAAAEHIRNAGILSSRRARRDMSHDLARKFLQNCRDVAASDVEIDEALRLLGDRKR